MSQRPTEKDLNDSFIMRGAPVHLGTKISRAAKRIVFGFTSVGKNAAFIKMIDQVYIDETKGLNRVEVLSSCGQFLDTLMHDQDFSHALMEGDFVKTFHEKLSPKDFEKTMLFAGMYSPEIIGPSKMLIDMVDCGALDTAAKFALLYPESSFILNTDDGEQRLPKMAENKELVRNLFLSLSEKAELKTELELSDLGWTVNRRDFSPKAQENLTKLNLWTQRKPRITPSMPL